MEDIDKQLIEDIAKKTEGFSGREIMKMAVAWHDAAFTTTDLVLTPTIMLRVLEKFQLQHKLKSTWTREEELIFGKVTNLKEDMQGSSQGEQTLDPNLDK